MSTNSSVKWIDLETCPVLKDESNEVIFPAGINKDNFIALEYYRRDRNRRDRNRIDFIRKYNIETNKWTTMDISEHTIWNDIILSDRSCYPVLDTKQSVIYFLNNTYLIQMELNSKKIIKHLLSGENNHHNSSSQCIFLNNELFVIGGTWSHSISKWNKRTKKLTPVSIIYHKKRLSLFGLICDNRTNSILIFGGWDNISQSHWGGVNHKKVDCILRYDASTNQCNKLPISLPETVTHPFCLKAINDTSVIIFDDDIYIYSIKRQTITKSKIKCPSANRFSGFIVNDKIKNDKIVLGFVRNTWNNCKIDDHFFPPFYLLKIIHSYYLNEWVFLLDKKTRKHYKMNTLDIVQ
eukprot:66578_1